jgi:hypothetical protein
MGGGQGSMGNLNNADKMAAFGKSGIGQFSQQAGKIGQGYNQYGNMLGDPMSMMSMFMGANGGYIPSKKRAGIPYAISPGISDAGMYVGPTTQRGITFADGGLTGEEGQVGPTVAAAKQQAVQNASKPYLNRAMVQAVLANADKPVTNTLGQVVSTPASREKERREKIVAKDPSKYSVEDYKQGIKEPGAENNVLADPIAMAAALTAGGVGLGAYGLTQVPRMFLGNLASEATAGLTDVRKLFTKRLPFKSEIDWAKWNKEIPENKALMQEYNAIEKRTKANGTWMKNSDGSSYQGTPEQFVQQNSQNFKNAFPEGYISSYRGSQSFDPTLSKSLRGNSNNHILFGTSDKATAEIYATNGGYNLDHLFKDVGKKPSFFHPDESIENIYTGMGEDVNPGMYQYALDERLPTITAEGSGNHWHSIKNDEALEWLKNNNPEYANDRIGFSKNPDLVKTDDIASYMIDKDIPIGISKNTIDSYNGIPSDIFMSNSKLARPKSLMYNNGMFDMTNPNIYKGLIPGAIGLKALQESLQQPEKKAQGGPIYNWIPNYPRVGVKQYNKKQSGGWLDNL